MSLVNHHKQHKQICYTHNESQHLMYFYLLQLDRIFWCRINGNRFQKTYYGQDIYWKMGAQKSVIERYPAFTTSSFDTSFVYLGDKLNFRPPFFLGLFLCRLDLSLSCLMILQSIHFILFSLYIFLHCFHWMIRISLFLLQF